MTTLDTETTEQITSITQLKEPVMYKVLLHNDDKTTVDFVIAVLTGLFHKSYDEAVALTLLIHETGVGIAGSPYTREIAYEKTLETISFARINNFPLVATYEVM